MKVGYVRVSKQEQNEELQIGALKEAGCDKWFLDKMTGSKAERKGRDEALAYVRSGDTFMIYNKPHTKEMRQSLTHLFCMWFFRLLLLRAARRARCPRG